jgi:hypothetical protein
MWFISYRAVACLYETRNLGVIQTDWNSVTLLELSSESAVKLSSDRIALGTA